MSTVTQHPHITYVGTDDKPKKLPSGAVKKLQRGWKIHQEIKKLNDELNKIKEALVDKYGVGAKLILPDEKASLTIVEKRAISIGDLELLRELIKDDDNCLFGMNAYTDRNTTYTPTDKYKEIIEDKEHEQHDLLVDTSKIKKTVSYNFRAIK